MKISNTYKGELFKVKLSVSVYNAEKEVFMRPQVEGIVGVNKLDVPSIIKAWFGLLYDLEDYNMTSQEMADHVEAVAGEAALYKLEPNKYIEIGIEEHPGHGQQCDLMGKVIGVYLGSKVSDSDMEAISNL